MHLGGDKIRLLTKIWIVGRAMAALKAIEFQPVGGPRSISGLPITTSPSMDLMPVRNRLSWFAEPFVVQDILNRGWVIV